MAKVPIDIKGQDVGASAAIEKVTKSLAGTLQVTKLTTKEIIVLRRQLLELRDSSSATANSDKNLRRTLSQLNQELHKRSAATKTASASTRQLTATTNTLASANTKAAVATKATGMAALNARRGISTMRGAMGTLAATSLGAQGRLGEVAGIMGSFAFGNVITLGILVGLAAIAFAFKGIAAEAREATEANEDFIASSPTLKAQGERMDFQTQLGRRSELQAQIGSGRLFVNFGFNERGFVKLQGDLLEQKKEELRELNIAIQDVVISRLNAMAGKGGVTPGVPGNLFDLSSLNVSPGPRVAAHLARMQGGPVFENSGMRILEETMRGDTIRRAGSPEEAMSALNKIARTMNEYAITTLPAALQQQKEGLESIAYGLKEGAEDIKTSSRQYISAISMSANAIAGMITGRSSVLGGMGGLAAGLSSIPKIPDGIGMGLGIAGIGLSFLDALTSNRGKDAMSEAHLKALTEHDENKGIATILINIPNFDPTNRDHQRIIDDARREAHASGFNVDVRQS